MDRLGGGQVWGRNAPGRDPRTPPIKHRQRLTAFISAPFFHFRTPFCEPAATGTPALQLERQICGEPRLAHYPFSESRSTQMPLRGAQALRRGRRIESLRQVRPPIPPPLPLGLGRPANEGAVRRSQVINTNFSFTPCCRNVE